MVDVVIPVPASRPEAPDYQSAVLMGSRADLPSGDRTRRRISLDFNAGGGRGVEIVVPEDVSDEEADLAQAYVTGVADLFKEFGYGDYPIRESSFRPGVKRRGRENPRGVANTFHTEPFFAEDEAARAIFMNPDFQANYVTLLNDTLRKIPGSVMMAPHEGPGADQGASFTAGDDTVTEYSMGMQLVQALAPKTEPTPEAEVDPIGAIIMERTRPTTNETISQALLAQSNGPEYGLMVSPLGDYAFERKSPEQTLGASTMSEFLRLRY